MDGSLEQLLTTDVSTLSRDDTLGHLAEVHALISRASAAMERDLAALTDRVDDLNDKCFDREEIACLLRWSSLYTQSRIVRAHKLVDHLPSTLAALGDGVIGPEHARAVAESCGFLDSALCGKVEEKILDRAGEQNVTELKRSLTRAVEAVDPRGGEQRHQQAQRRRDVYPSLLPDGMGGLFSTHTAADLDAMMAALQHVADQDRGDGRLVGERRADALRDLVLGRVQPVPPPPKPVKPVKHHPITLADSFRYEACPALREKVIRRDQTCRYIGRHRQAVNCELDHIEPYNGSNTVEANLQALCPRHHHLKHESDWLVRRLDDGSTEWTSPTGRIYVKPPPEPEEPP